MNRRTVIRNAAATLVLLPHVLHAQPPSRVFRLGYIGLTAPDPAVAVPPGLDQWQAFKDEMRALGFIEGQNYLLERSYIEGREERIPRLVADFLDKNVDVLITSRTDAARAAKQATRTVPIVMAGLSNPERSGLVESLSRPGGNITGVSNMFVETEAKIVELFKEALPNRSRLGITTLRNKLEGTPEGEALLAAAKILRVTVIHSQVRAADDIEVALTTLLRQHAEALYPSQALLAHRLKVGDFSIANRLPLFTRSREWPSALLAYGVYWPDIFRLVARQVAQILKGTKPADMPVQQPTKFHMLVNLKVAKTLGIALPPSLLVRADEIIE